MQKLLHLSQIQMWEFCRICKNIEICIPIEYISFSLTVYLPFISEEISDNDIDCLLLICILIKLMQISQNYVDIVYLMKYNIDKKGGKRDDGDYSTSLDHLINQFSY